ncbi:MAG: hypothetical protein ABSB33_04455 [Tepidisphaeraceae bacterium]
MTCRAGRYRIEKQVVTDPQRNTVLQRIQFVAMQGDLSDYHLHVLLAPHLGNHGDGNNACLSRLPRIATNNIQSTAKNKRPLKSPNIKTRLQSDLGGIAGGACGRPVIAKYFDDYPSFAGSNGEARRIEFWRTIKNLG